jgi:hypothetical protein
VCVLILTPSHLFIRAKQLPENTPSPLRMCLGSAEETTRGRWARTALRRVRLTCGVSRSRVGSDLTAFHLGDYQVGPKVGMGVFVVFLSCFRGEVGPWIRVLALDWSNVCFLGSIRCHGHMALVC